MRPRSFDRGNETVKAEAKPEEPASMRPRSFDRGNQESDEWQHQICLLQ